MVSGHKSELTVCGLTYAALWEATMLSGLNMTDVFAAFKFLYESKVNCCASYMEYRFGRGWSVNSFRTKVCDTLRVLAVALRPTMDRQFIFHDRNDLFPYFDSDVKIALDTVPIYIDEKAHCFTKKYAECVAKMLVATTFTGRVVFTSGLYTGASPDQLILEHCGLLEMMADLKIRALGDGAFSSPLVLKPPTKKQIWRPRRADETMDEYNLHAERMLQEVTMHSNFRSRIEHAFGRSRLGRFDQFKNWKAKDFQMLTNSVVAALGAINLETFARHGTAGCYGPIDREAVDERILEHKTASRRYPRPEIIITEDQASTARAAAKSAREAQAVATMKTTKKVASAKKEESSTVALKQSQSASGTQTTQKKSSAEPSTIILPKSQAARSTPTQAKSAPATQPARTTTKQSAAAKKGESSTVALKKSQPARSTPTQSAAPTQAAQAAAKEKQSKRNQARNSEYQRLMKGKTGMQLFMESVDTMWSATKYGAHHLVDRKKEKK